MTLRLALLSASVFGLSTPLANAQGLFSFDPAEGGFIVSGYVGTAFPNDAEYSGTQNPETGVPGAAGAAANVEAEFDNSTTFGGTIGYQLPFKYWKYFHPRLELEISSFEADVEDGNFNGNDLNFSGEQKVTSYLLNNYSDIVWTENQRWVPFIGGGIGFSNVDANVLYQGGAEGAPNPTFGVVGDDSAFTTTFGGGLTLRTNAQFELYGEARYTQIYGVELERRFIPTGGFSANVEDDLQHGALIFGARLRF